MSIRRIEPTAWVEVRRMNGAPIMKRQIGWVVLDEPRPIMEYYEFAAWYQKGTAQPGCYALYETRHLGYSWFSAPVPAVVESACFASHFGGVPFGTDRGGREAVGKVFEFSIQLHGYQVDAAAKAGA